MLRRYLHLKVGDAVKIIAGDDRKKIGKVLVVDTKRNLIKVSGVNIQTHYVKKTNERPGSIERKEGWIHISNAAKIEEEIANETV